MTDKINLKKWHGSETNAHIDEKHIFLNYAISFFCNRFIFLISLYPVRWRWDKKVVETIKTFPLILSPTFLKLLSSEDIFGWIGKHVCFLFYLPLLPYWERGCHVFSWQWPKKNQRCYAVFSGCRLSSPLGSMQEPQSFLPPWWCASSCWPFSIG